ncbi:diguanylate cyclase [Mitsuaria sp. CC2]|uniref:diguanylate cyclase n=1 Tax=Mitsuaria sp. CC2 TaxID=3029186 RepID=UPI003B8C3B63
MPSILIVDDNIHLIALMGRMLEPLADVSFATHGPAALRAMKSRAPDLVLLDEQMPGMSGNQVCQTMQEDPELAAIPVVFVTGHDDADAEVRALTSGAVDFIAKPINEAVLVARVRTQLRIKSLSDQLLRSATLDGLTGLTNRGDFDRRLSMEWARAARSGGTLSLVILDVDHFKRFNDHYGHPAGDRCLQAVANVIGTQARRAADVAARFGGEEFTLLLPDTSLTGAQEAAERVRREIESMNVAHAASPTASCVTVSMGVAACQPLPCAVVSDGASRLVELADQALYAAKSLGRNRVCLSEGDPAMTTPRPSGHGATVLASS